MATVTGFLVGAAVGLWLFFVAHKSVERNKWGMIASFLDGLERRGIVLCNHRPEAGMFAQSYVPNKMSVDRLIVKAK